MSEEFKNEGAKGSEAPKKVVKKRKISTYAGGTQNQGYGGYGSYGNYGGYNPYGGYGSYGNYGSYGSYGSAYAASQQAAVNEIPNRTFADYLQILKEKFWFIAITFLIILSGCLLYTFTVQREYTSRASIHILRDVDNPVEARKTRSDLIVDQQDLMTQVKLLESMEVVNYVKKQLKPEEISRLMAPYHDMITFGQKVTEEYILVRNRRIIPERMTLLVYIEFHHPDAEIAAKVANLYAREFIAYSQHVNSSDMLLMIDSLRDKVNQQDKKVRELEKKMVDYRRENTAISLDQKVDILANELASITASLTESKQVYESVQTEWKMIQDYQREKKNLWELPSIARNQRVAALLPERSSLLVDIAQLEKRYKPKHPKMIEFNRRLDQLNNELNAAVESAVKEIEATHDIALKNYENLQKSLAEKKAERSDLDEKRVAYGAIEREKITAEALHLELEQQMNKRLAEINLIPASAKIVDVAVISPDPSYPNYVLNIAIGVIGGLAGGIIMAFAVAFFDDRTKSAHDVESVIGIPLLGAIPRIKRLSSAEKAQISASNADRGAAEAFRAVLSSIKLSPIGKMAKVILSTSTTPSEGKSFVLSNLAFTAAMNGEKCIIIDADLRLPAVARILNISAKKGLVSYMEGKSTLDESIVKEYFPNLDVLPSEKRAPNPTQVLNSEAFVSMLQDLRTKYDKIFIDTPPIGAVSDAISLLPYVDGIIYVIKHNAIKRKVIKSYIRKLLESNVPILGAVMNMVSTSAQAYSTSYYNKAYTNYYVDTPPEEFEEAEETDSTETEEKNDK